MKRRSPLPSVVNLAVLILMEIAALYMLSSNSELQKEWLARGAHGVMGAVWGGTQTVKNYFSLGKTNKALSQEVFELSTQLAKAKEALREAGVSNTETPEGRGFEFIPAEVVKISRNKQHNYLILNRGYEDGVKEKSGVVTNRGVVGIIDAVSARHSFAFSFQNSDISISARLGQEGAVGPLVWDGRHSGTAILKEIPLQYKVSPGDTVYTSGHSLMFPPDIPVGVTGASRMVNGATNEYEVSLFQDFSAVRYVSVVHNTAFEEIQEGGL